MPDCQYYTFYHEFGKHWRNTKEEIKQGDFTMDQFFVNLAWRVTKDIRVELSGCRSLITLFFPLALYSFTLKI